MGGGAFPGWSGEEVDPAQVGRPPLDCHSVGIISETPSQDVG